MLCHAIFCAPLSECEQSVVSNCIDMLSKIQKSNVVISPPVYDIRIPGSAALRQRFGVFLAVMYGTNV